MFIYIYIYIYMHISITVMFETASGQCHWIVELQLTANVDVNLVYILHKWITVILLCQNANLLTWDEVKKKTPHPVHNGAKSLLSIMLFLLMSQMHFRISGVLNYAGRSYVFHVIPWHGKQRNYLLFTHTNFLWHKIFLETKHGKLSCPFLSMVFLL